jgi:phage terminase large subunit-like protein
MNSKHFPPAWLTPVEPENLDSKRAKLAIEFVEAFGIITKDSVAGKRGSALVLRDWQRELIRYIYADDGDGGLKHRVSLVGMPRKSGKSALLSSLSIFDLLMGPNGGECYSVASEKEQARIVFASAKAIIEAHPSLMELCKLYRDAIEVPTTGSVYRVLSAENLSKEGLNSTSVFFDELHAQRNRDLFDVLSLSMGARGAMAHLVAITTAGTRQDSTGRDSIAFTLYQYGQRVARGEEQDPSFFMAWWEANPDADYRLPETWIAANPGLGEDGQGDICSLEDFESAIRRTPEAEFRTKRCNQWVSSQISWLPSGSWEKCKGEIELDPEREYVLGFDGSFSNDSTVIIACTIPEGDEPAEMFVIKAWEKDPNIHDDGWRVDITDVEQTIIDHCARFPKVREIACDPFRWQRTMAVLQERGLPIIEYPSTSPARMVGSCSKFYDAVMEGGIIHDGNPLLTRHLDNAVVKLDHRGPRIVKETRNSPRKIDAAVAAVVSFDRATQGKLEDEIIPQVFI